MEPWKRKTAAFLVPDQLGGKLHNIFRVANGQFISHRELESLVHRNADRQRA